MATRQTTNRIFWRRQSRSGEARAYADFRDFEDVGGKQEALIPSGLGRATSDKVIAEMLVAKRLAELQALRRDRILLGSHKRISLSELVQRHIGQKSKAGSVTDGWISESRKKLDDASNFFGGDRDIATLTVDDVQQWVTWLRHKGGRCGNQSISGGTVRHYLNCLSNLYRRASAEGYVSPGFNPVSAMMEKPVAVRREADWLEVPEATALLDAATERPRSTSRYRLSSIYPLLATFLLTGGRESEILGLEIQDVSFSRRTITFRPNSWRRLKTVSSARTVPLWPQLETVLHEYLNSKSAPQGKLLFPSSRFSEDRPIDDIRKSLDRLARVAGINRIPVRTKVFRHTYCAARLQTLDNGFPISLWTVSRELGHGGTSLVERVYGHLGQMRHRASCVEYFSTL